MARCSPHLPAMRNLRISASSWRPSSRKFPLRKTNHRLGNQEIAASWTFAEDASVATKVCGFKYSLPSAKKSVFCCISLSKGLRPAFVRSASRELSAFLLKLLWETSRNSMSSSTISYRISFRYSSKLISLSLAWKLTSFSLWLLQLPCSLVRSDGINLSFRFFL